MIQLSDLQFNKKDELIFKLIGNETYYLSSMAHNFIAIQSDYFEIQWRKSSFLNQTVVACINDRKKESNYHEAKKYFIESENFPVPLVKVEIEIENNEIIPTLIDGLSRTNFLLANNVKYLVFEVDKDLSLIPSTHYFLFNRDEL